MSIESKNSESEADIALDFSGLVLGLSSAALSYMGFLPTGSAGKDPRNLGLAAQNIEILVLLLEKTKGNLTEDEDRLIRQALTDLRVKFVEAGRQ